RLLIAHHNYWELEPGRGWLDRGPVPGWALYGALFEDEKTGNVFHCFPDNWTVHEWDPQRAQVVGKHKLGVNPGARYLFTWLMRPCLVGRDIFVLNVSAMSAFTFNLDTRTGRAVELDRYPLLPSTDHTCIAHGSNVLVLADTGEMWEVDPRADTCRAFPAQGT